MLMPWHWHTSLRSPAMLLMPWRYTRLAAGSNAPITGVQYGHYNGASLGSLRNGSLCRQSICSLLSMCPIGTRCDCIIAIICLVARMAPLSACRRPGPGRRAHYAENGQAGIEAQGAWGFPCDHRRRPATLLAPAHSHHQSLVATTTALRGWRFSRSAFAGEAAMGCEDNRR